METPLNEERLREALQALPSGWALKAGKLHRDFEFKNFDEAFSFVMRVAMLARRHNHHPDIAIAYNQVSLDLVTHDVGGITLSDIGFAKEVD